MKRTDLLKQILPGLLPILIFIIADEYFGTQIGIIVAVIVGLLELIYFYVKEHRIEKFIIIDSFLLILFGGISLIFDNDAFFKLKPAIMELIMVVVLGISAFSPKNLMLNMSQRFMNGMEITDVMRQKMRQNSQVLFFIFLFHALLIVYSVFYMSQEAWAFISTALFYIIMGAYFLFELARNKFLLRKK